MSRPLISRAVLAAVGVLVLLGPVGCLLADSGANPERASTDLGPLRAGQVHWGEERYVEYRVGSLPLILSAPHGGLLEPAEVPDRTRGYPIGDSDTQDLTRRVADALAELTGRAPHVVISRLARVKLDPNRDEEEAAQHPSSRRAWREYHGFIETARGHVAASWGAGLYLDVHGHGHRTPWIELGYLVTEAELNRSDRRLDRLGRRHSMRALAGRSPLSTSELLRGPTSLGALLEARGYRSVPSPSDPGPGTASYFSGGYSTLRHGAYRGGRIDGIQLEHPKHRVREGEAHRRTYARQLAEVLVEYLEAHYGFELEAKPPAGPSSESEGPVDPAPKGGNRG